MCACVADVRIVWHGWVYMYICIHVACMCRVWCVWYVCECVCVVYICVPVMCVCVYGYVLRHMYWWVFGELVYMCLCVVCESFVCSLVICMYVRVTNKYAYVEKICLQFSSPPIHAPLCSRVIFLKHKAKLKLSLSLLKEEKKKAKRHFKVSPKPRDGNSRPTSAWPQEASSQAPVVWSCPVPAHFTCSLQRGRQSRD